MRARQNEITQTCKQRQSNIAQQKLQILVFLKIVLIYLHDEKKKYTKIFTQIYTGELSLEDLVDLVQILENTSGNRIRSDQIVKITDQTKVNIKITVKTKLRKGLVMENSI